MKTSRLSLLVLKILVTLVLLSYQGITSATVYDFTITEGSVQQCGGFAGICLEDSKTPLVGSFSIDVNGDSISFINNDVSFTGDYGFVFPDYSGLFGNPPESNNAISTSSSNVTFTQEEYDACYQEWQAQAPNISDYMCSNGIGGFAGIGAIIPDETSTSGDYAVFDGQYFSGSFQDVTTNTAGRYWGYYNGNIINIFGDYDELASSPDFLLDVFSLSGTLNNASVPAPTSFILFMLGLIGLGIGYSKSTRATN